MKGYCYKIVDGELEARACVDGVIDPEGWNWGDSKFSPDAREKARAALHAINPVVPGPVVFNSRSSRKKRR